MNEPTMSKQKKERDQQQEPRQSTLREYFLTTVVCTIFALFVTNLRGSPR